MFYSMWNWFTKGGTVMIPIIGFSVVAATFIIERFIYFKKIKHDSLFFMKQFTDLWDKSKMEDIAKLCDVTPGPLARLLKAGVTAYRKKPNTVKSRMNTVIMEEVPKLEKYLSLIAVIGTIEPMLGLLGTVVGMIRCFTVIALKGTGDPQALAGGISEALITTEMGLVIAIPIIYLHNILVNKADAILGDAKKGVSNFMAMVEEK